MKLRAFSVAELLVVIAIIAILAAILFPVFVSAKEAAKSTACLAQNREIGIAFELYVRDCDDLLPLASFPNPAYTWTKSLSDYLGGKQILRCPSDTSDNWSQGRLSSYFLNAWLTPNAPTPYLSVDRIGSPASVIYLAESARNRLQDHFPPYCWNEHDPLRPAFCTFMAPFFDSEGYPLALDARRHHGGMNSVFTDGHARWATWSSLWFEKTSEGVYDGKFDPRQP